MPNQIYVKREIFPKIKKHLDNKEITLIIGPRQVGKTVLLKQLQKHLIEDKNASPELIFSFNLDIFSDRELFLDQKVFIDYIRQKSKNKKIYVFIDEAQKVKEAGVFFKGVYDSGLNAKFILTGSSNLEIRSKIQESLAGRKRIFHLLPFSFLEILGFKNKKLHKAVVSQEKIFSTEEREIKNLFFQYCIFGSYPQVVLADETEEKIEYIKEIFNSYIEKDIIGFLKIEKEANFIKLVKLLSGQIGNLLRVSELATLINTDHYTVNRYLSNLERTFVTFNLLPFYRNPRQEIVKAPKIYFFDNGIRNFGIEKFNQDFVTRDDRGELLENITLKELLVLKYYYKNFNIRFWRTKQGAELDFVLEKENSVLAIEVKSDLRSDKLTKSFFSFLNKFKPSQALVINLGFCGERIVGETKVNFIFPWMIKDFL